MTLWKIKPCCKVMESVQGKNDLSHRYTNFRNNTQTGPIGTITLVDDFSLDEEGVRPRVMTCPICFCPWCGKEIEMEKWKA